MRHLALVWSALAATAVAGSPRLTHTYPSGGQRGAEIEIACSGGSYADARELMFDEPASFKLVEFKLPEEKDKRLRAKIAIAADARLGEHSYRIVTNTGISDTRLFYVSPFPMVEEAPENKDNPNAPQPIPLGTTVYAGRKVRTWTALRSRRRRGSGSAPKSSPHGSRRSRFSTRISQSPRLTERS